MPSMNGLLRARIARTALVLAATCIMASACSRLDRHAERGPPPAPPKCKEAVVNPVSGYASCVNPLGAPVDPPPKRPN
jgi:hypothetical protein